MDYNYETKDLNGKIIRNGAILSSIIIVDIRQVPEGLYFIQIYDHNKLIHAQRLIKK
ncbi:MAG: hypothetical protein IPJ43_14730 [Saprospiraceae bacterium]|nr:hypothetical protein [Saprospiraceae bacterium]